MNRYPWWKYAILLVALLLGALYTAPNFFGEAPAVQVSAGKSTVKVDETTLERVRSTLAGASIPVELLAIEGSSVRARFGDTDTQIKAKDAIARALNPDPADERFIVALNLVSRTPQWMARLRALPMYLGLDLRGGVHFLMEVDMRAALRQQIDGYASDARNALREKRIRFSGITREAEGLTVGLPEPATADTARDLLAERMPAIQWAVQATPEGTRLVGRLQPQAVAEVQKQALSQNIETLHKRVNELGVAEPVIQQQGLNRVVVQLPGVQDTARAKTIIGRTATLQIRLVETDLSAAAETVPERMGPGETMPRMSSWCRPAPPSTATSARP
jgi:preprotein translocase subunit SecD